MITPRFDLVQNETTVTITIRAPYCSPRELDVSAEDNVFIFLCNPYYLRLNLPGNILENDRAVTRFDAVAGEFTFTYEKEHSGEHFPDLDLITTLLCSKVQAEEGGRKIEVLTIGNDEVDGVTVSETTEEYGFAMRGGYNITNLDSEFTEVFKINPHKVKLEERRLLRVKDENERFSPDHYLADYLDNLEIEQICSFNCPWANIASEAVSFSSKELDFMKDLPNIQYNLNSTQIQYCHNSLLEILFAYCYDRRTTYFEGTCESGWTISTLSASLSWFDGFADPKAAIVCAYRRSLIFPLHRSFALSEQVLSDLKILLRLGDKFLIKCLIEVYYIFLHGDAGRFILNNLFVKDYITYVMKWNKESWSHVVDDLMAVKIEKSDLGLSLKEIENSVNFPDDVSKIMTELKLDSDDSYESESHSSYKSESNDSYESESIDSYGSESNDSYESESSLTEDYSVNSFDSEISTASDMSSSNYESCDCMDDKK